ncbi:hypothetical protein [Gilliamella sp. ESL0250]|uniref:hypothetical protein n=1 Tax=Gilliamella sp. ESL0250 TaxID=2705036 RepID=UPI0015806D94|nr:hypothetical protein [Gilliamella sp. ESL0250]NUF50019.1 hypothetical protein [Gilliamella sp. ESL0250]
MNSFKSIDELIMNLYLLDQGEWIYANLELWNSDPKHTEFYYIPWDYIQDLNDDEIYLDEEGMEMPFIVQGLNLRGWMLVGSLDYIAQNKSNYGHDDNWFIDEINYYRANDTFRI